MDRHLPCQILNGGSDWKLARRHGGWQVVRRANLLGHCLNSLLDEVNNSSGFTGRKTGPSIYTKGDWKLQV